MKKPTKKTGMAMGGMTTQKKPMIMLDKKKPVAPATGGKSPMIMLDKKKPVAPATGGKSPMIMRKK